MLLYVSISFAQSELNGYKYIIVPKKFNFLKGEADKYKLNSLTKFLFSKNGFETLFEDDKLPEDLFANPCLAARVNVVNESKMFKTNMVIELKNCHNQVVFSSLSGSSREKEYKKAYHEAIRNAFVSIEALQYKYDHSLNINNTIIVNSETEKVALNAVIVANAPNNTKTVDRAIAKEYKNESISFFLIKQNNSLMAYVSESKDGAYQKGEMIGTLIKTSIPNVFRVTWKNQKGENKETTGYFDEGGNLKIDINHDGKIEVIVFKVDK